MASPATKTASWTSLLMLLVIVNCWQVAHAAQESSRVSTDLITNLMLSPTSHKIAAQWHLRNPSGQVASFRVEWRKEGGFAGERHRCTVQHHISERQFYSTNQCKESPRLLPCTTYSVMVTGMNSQAQAITERSLQRGYTMTGVNNLTATSVGGRSVAVSWGRPDTSCDDTEYYITYYGWAELTRWKIHSGSVGVKHGGVAKSTYHFNLTGMVPSSVYSVCVIGANPEVNGSKICVYNVHTDETEPSAPSSFTLEPSAHDITATWKKPMEHNGVLGPYNVSWQCGANTAYELVNTTAYIIKGLLACVGCRVRVTASTAAGEGESSEATSWTQPEALAPVTLLSSSTAGARSITLWWQRPDTLCNITSYYITYDGKAMWGEKNPLSGSVVVQEDLAKTFYFYNLIGLVPYARYNVCVAAGYQGGSSSVECREVLQTKQARPSEPSAFSVVSTAHTVRATWQVPQEHNGVLGPYNISWECGANKSNELINTTVYTIEGLPAGVECKVRVAASTEAGEGERSEESVWIPSEDSSVWMMGYVGGAVATFVVVTVGIIVGGVRCWRRGQDRKTTLRQRSTDKAVEETAPTTTATTIALAALEEGNDGEESTIAEAGEESRPLPSLPPQPVHSGLESESGDDYCYPLMGGLRKAIVDETTPMMGDPGICRNDQQEKITSYVDALTQNLAA